MSALADRYAPLTHDAVRALWRAHAPPGGAESDPPWAFLHALFAAWRAADDTRQAVVMGWTTPGAVDALRRGDGACHIHPQRTRNGGKTPVGVLYLAPVAQHGTPDTPDRAA